MRWLCRLGLHKWTQWEYWRSEDEHWWNLEGERHCLRCAKSVSVFRRAEMKRQAS